ncbi:ABC transporter permease [Microbacterium sp. 18062]|uniref:ABC transporter permease n=1 Tax=Microbacterium sp. 18062 TaxID=2681410 RepID=UPI00135A55A7|nr:ABC transporter permease [Microbacterium sp. 18062]
MRRTRTIGGLLLRAVLVALGVVLAAFLLLQVVPGDVATALLGSHATPESVARLRAQLGLDLPWHERLGSFFLDLLSGGGTSLVYGESVRSLIAARAGVTLAIVGLAMLFAIVFSAGLAITAALNHNRLADQVIRVLTTSALAVPAFLLAMVLILVFSVNLRWFPVGGSADGLRSLVLPAVTAALGVVPVLTRSLRVQLLSTADADFLFAARSAGMSRTRVVLTYLLPNASIPALTLVGVNFAYLVGGTFIVEKVFAISGVGSLMFDSISQRDIPVVQELVVYTALVVVLINLVTEAAVRAVDPRRRRRTV